VFELYRTRQVKSERMPPLEDVAATENQATLRQ
jgi:hypothetical protein